MIRLRPLADTSVYTCDWGYCDDVAVAERATGDPVQPWLPVCQRHAGKGRRRGPSTRGTCPACGRVYALTLAGRLRAHDAGFAHRCPGVGRRPDDDGLSPTAKPDSHPDGEL